MLHPFTCRSNGLKTLQEYCIILFIHCKCREVLLIFHYITGISVILFFNIFREKCTRCICRKFQNVCALLLYSAVYSLMNVVVNNRHFAYFDCSSHIC